MSGSENQRFGGSVEPQEIQFIMAFNQPRAIKKIKREFVNVYNFSRGFNEKITKNTPYIHPYFDIDDLKTVEEFYDFIEYCDKAKTILGDYSVGGYTNNESISDEIGLKYNEEAEKTISFHVVFYEAMVTPAEMLTFINECKNELHQAIDFNVYKLGSSQLFRHCLSDKHISSDTIKHTAGIILDDKEPVTQIITATGDELEVTSNDLKHAFGIHASNYLNDLANDMCLNYEDDLNWPYDHADESEVEPTTQPNNNKLSEASKATSQRLEPAMQSKKPAVKRANGDVSPKTARRSKGLSKMNINDTAFEDDLIKLSPEDLLELLNDITTEPHNNDLVHTIVPLYHSPYTVDEIYEVVNEWYHQISHKTSDNPMQIIRSIYSREDSNKWIFSLIKKIPDSDKAEKWRDEFKKEHVDMSVNINNSQSCYTDINKRSYRITEFSKIITDLRGVVAMCGSRYFIKERQDGQYIISECTKESFNDTLNKRKPFYGNTKISLAHVVNAYSNYFLYDDLKLFKPCNENKELEETTINIFQGYKYQEVITDDFSILEPLLNHIKEVNCNGDERKYEYIMNWYANIIQNLAVKNGTLPIIYGSQGSGKSLFVEIMAELLGSLAITNADDLDKVFGKFNGIVEKKVLVVLNEIGEATDKFAYSEKMKSRITQVNTLYEKKGIETKTGLNYANYIMTANYANPIKSQKGDRRTIYFPTNNKYCGDRKYFKELCKPFQPVKQGPYVKQYMGVLLHYMLTQFKPEEYDLEELIFETNQNTQTQYNEQLERQYTDLNAVEGFVVDNYQYFLIGYPVDFIRLEGYKQKGISTKLQSLCEEPKRIRTTSKEAKRIQEEYNKLPNPHGINTTIYDALSSKQIRVYKLKVREEIPDLFNIIDYKMFQDKYDEENNEDTKEAKFIKELAE